MKTAKLANRAIIDISGVEAEHFLENLVTCNVRGLKDNEAAFGALLTPQGKIMYDFFLQKCANSYRIDTAADLADEFAKRLLFYKLRAKVDISGPENITVTGLWNGEPAASADFMPDTRHPRMGFRVYDFAFDEADESDYRQLRVNLGIPEGGTDFKYGDAYPHETLMDQFGGVDFKKGCYVGQEVVSRMQHRGTAKKRIVKIASDRALPKPGAGITADGKPAGNLGSVCGSKGLALLRLDRIAGADIVLAGDAVIDVEIPDWVNFTMPEVTG